MYGSGLGGAAGIIRFTKGAFTNVKCEILDVIAEEDRAATFFTYYAEHVGDMFGLAGEGRSFKGPNVHILRFRVGKVCEHWRVENELSMMKQFGRLPGSFEYEATAETMKDWERDRMKIGPRDG